MEAEKSENLTETTDNQEVLSDSQNTSPETKKEYLSWQFPKINLLKLNEKLGLYASLSLKIFGFLLFAGLLVLLIKELRQNNYVMENFKVPETAAKNGLDGQVLANRIADKIEEIKATAKIRKEVQTYLKNTSRPDVKMEVLGVGFSVESVIRFLKESFGVPVKSISGDLVKADSSYVLSLRMTGKPVQVFRQPLQKEEEKTLEALIEDAGAFILKQNDPILLAFYHLNRSRIFTQLRERPYIANEAEKAIAASHFALLHFPNDKKWAYSTWGLALVGKKLYKDASEKTQQALDIDSSFALAHDAHGLVLQHLGKHPEAISHFKKAIQLDSTYSTAWANLGHEMKLASMVYNRKEDAFEAVQAYRKAIDLDPNNPNNVAYALFISLNMEASRSTEEAMKILRQLIEKDPTSPQNLTYYNFWSAALYRKGRIKEAFEKINEAIRIDSASTAVLQSIGIYYFETGQYDLLWKNIRHLEKNCQREGLGESSCWMAPLLKLVYYDKLVKKEEMYRELESVCRLDTDVWLNLSPAIQEKYKDESRFQKAIAGNKALWEIYYYGEDYKPDVKESVK